MTSKINPIIFKDWFSMEIPDKWVYENEEDLITIFSTEKKAKGTLHISCYKVYQSNEDADEFAMNKKSFYRTILHTLI